MLEGARFNCCDGIPGKGLRRGEGEEYGQRHKYRANESHGFLPKAMDSQPASAAPSAA